MTSFTKTGRYDTEALSNKPNDKMDDCFQVINSVLLELATTNSQFPFLAWSGEGCTGTMYPPAGSFGYWDQVVTSAEIGFSEIRSMFIPHQSVLKVWSQGQTGPTGYFSVAGPLIVPDNRSYLANWSRWDGIACDGIIDVGTATTACGKKVQWLLDQPASSITSIGSLVLHNPVGWTSYLAAAAARGQLPGLQTPSGLKTTYSLDYDTLYSSLCTTGQNRFACGCHDAYQALLRDHPAAAQDSFVNLTPNSCNPSTQYVPSQAKVGNGSIYECADMINAQLRTGTFPSLSNGGSGVYMCANRAIPNAYSDGSTTVSNRVESDVSSTNEQPSAYTYAIIGVLVFIAVCMTVARVAKVRRPSHQNLRNPGYRNTVASV